MTALDGLDRLESPGLWRPEPGAQRRDVYVSLGASELVIEDKSGTALSHWSLPALVRVNPGEMPALFGPSAQASEELEIDETEMVTALDRVVQAVEQGRTRPGALRRLTIGLALGFLVGLGALWLPRALREHADTVMPVAQRTDIGQRMLADLTSMTGPACADSAGVEALIQLNQRLFPSTPIELVVLRDLPQPAMALPGGLVALSDTILVSQDDPDVAAGHVLAAVITASAEAPLTRFIDSLSIVELARTLASGHVPDGTIPDHVEGLLLDPVVPVSPDAMRPGFDGARIAWSPYATAMGLPMGEAAPSRMPPALDDTQWQVLREICNG